MLVSAIITTCKRPPYIVERALKSVLAQTYSNLEILVMDDSPTSYSERQDVKYMVDSYDGVRYIPLKENMGACAARNIGIENSCGEYIAFLDDDDEWLSEKIEKQMREFQNERVGLVYCGSKTMNDIDGKETLRDTEFYRGEVFDTLIQGNFIGSTSFPLIRRSCLVEIGGFDVEQKSAQDYDVWLKIAKQWEVSYVEDILVTYHVHGLEQISTNYGKKVSGLERLNDKYRKYLDEHPDAYHMRMIKMAPIYVGNGQYKKAFLSYCRAVVKKPLKVSCNIKYLYRVVGEVIHSMSKNRGGGYRLLTDFTYKWNTAEFTTRYAGGAA